jgi:hypothetical protein
MSDPRFEPELVLELSEEEILEDLCWPHPPPGRWDVYPASGRPTVSARRSGSSRSRKRASGSTPRASRIVL